MMDINTLKYPIGTYEIPKEITNSHIDQWIRVIQDFPAKVEETVLPLSLTEHRFRYRPEGWTIHQVVNHCLDSHTNSVIRFKLALTEKEPVIRPYEEAKWAILPDTIVYPIEDTLAALDQVHKRWVFLLQRLTSNDWSKSFVHPAGNKKVRLDENLCIYAWHCNHHFEHIKNALKYKY